MHVFNLHKNKNINSKTSIRFCLNCNTCEEHKDFLKKLRTKINNLKKVCAVKKSQILLLSKNSAIICYFQL